MAHIQRIAKQDEAYHVLEKKEQDLQVELGEKAAEEKRDEEQFTELWNDFEQQKSRATVLEEQAHHCQVAFDSLVKLLEEFEYEGCRCGIKVNLFV